MKPESTGIQLTASKTRSTPGHVAFQGFKIPQASLDKASEKNLTDVADERTPRALPKNAAFDTRLLTLKEAATLLTISLATIRAWVWQRKIEVVRIGRCVRIREQVISELILTNTIPPTTKP